VVLVVTHEPELFRALKPVNWRLEQGRLNPMDPEGLRTMPATTGRA
jgi:hypothetical protein